MTVALISRTNFKIITEENHLRVDLRALKIAANPVAEVAVWNKKKNIFPYYSLYLKY